MLGSRFARSQQPGGCAAGQPLRVASAAALVTPRLRSGREGDVMEDWLSSALRRVGVVGVSTIVGTAAFATAMFADVSAASAKPPEVERVTPTQGPTTGGKEVEITGKVLAPNGPCAFSFSLSRIGPSCPEMIVYFGNEPGFIFEATKSSVLAIFPSHAEGEVDVRVVTPMGTSAVNKRDKFTYEEGETPPQVEGQNPPKITAVEESHGPTGGFNPVTIRGEHLLPEGAQACVQCAGVLVHFGTGNLATVTAATGAPDGLLVYAPPHAVETVGVTVTTNPGGNSNAVPYTYQDPPKHSR
jgi:hypothetical protein